MNKTDVIIIGAGAAGLMCAIEAGKRGRSVLVLDHANKAGKKILMSGGGRCNFTNYHINPADYISHNPHFCKSALSRYTQWDFIELVKKYAIPFHEKTLGQLFCDHKSQDILNMLLAECANAKVSIYLNAEIQRVEKTGDKAFALTTVHGQFVCESLVIATGGLSIPTMGASPFAYKMAEQFGLKVWPTRAGLVPFTLHAEEKEKLSVLSGVSIDSRVNHDKMSFRENILFTHRGLSGPAILQISSYWQPGEEVMIDLLPELDVLKWLKSERQEHPLKNLKTTLSVYLPKRMIEIFFSAEMLERKLATMSNSDCEQLAHHINQWRVKPNGTEGYRTAEVTLGGVDCDALSSKTMEVRQVPGLYFIGEAVDVTGWLGGYNFQWAWSSGWAAGQVI
jgi:predicted Rossmann fold flavoprotein